MTSKFYSVDKSIQTETQASHHHQPPKTHHFATIFQGPWQIQSCSQESHDNDIINGHVVRVPEAALGSLEPSASKRRHQQDGGIAFKNGGQRGSLQTTTENQAGKPGFFVVKMSNLQKKGPMVTVVCCFFLGGG